MTIKLDGTVHITVVDDLNCFTEQFQRDAEASLRLGRPGVRRGFIEDLCRERAREFVVRRRTPLAHAERTEADAVVVLLRWCYMMGYYHVEV